MSDTNKPAARSSFAQSASRLALGIGVTVAGATGVLEEGAKDALEVMNSALPQNHQILSAEEMEKFGISSARADVVTATVVGNRIMGCSFTQTCTQIPTLIKGGSASMSGAAWLGVGLLAACAADATFETGMICDFAFNQALKRGLESGDITISNDCDQRTGERVFRLTISDKRSIHIGQLTQNTQDGHMYWTDPETKKTKRIIQSKREVDSAQNASGFMGFMDVDVVQDEFAASSTSIKPERILQIYKAMTERVEGSYILRAGGNGVVDDPNLSNVGSLTWHARFTAEKFKPSEASADWWRRQQRTSDEVFGDILGQVAKSLGTTPEKLTVGYTPARQIPATGWQITKKF